MLFVGPQPSMGHGYALMQRTDPRQQRTRPANASRLRVEFGNESLKCLLTSLRLPPVVVILTRWWWFLFVLVHHLGFVLRWAIVVAALLRKCATWDQGPSQYRQQNLSQLNHNYFAASLRPLFHAWGRCGETCCQRFEQDECQGAPPASIVTGLRIFWPWFVSFKMSPAR